jgi:hypothetical protein
MPNEIINHKGDKCILGPNGPIDGICQEGYCSDCQLYLNWEKLMEDLFE